MKSYTHAKNLMINKFTVFKIVLSKILEVSEHGFLRYVGT